MTLIVITPVPRRGRLPENKIALTVLDQIHKTKSASKCRSSTSCLQVIWTQTYRPRLGKERNQSKTASEKYLTLRIKQPVQANYSHRQ